MARRPIRIPVTGERRPRLTQPNGQPLSNQQLGQNIDNWVTEVFTEELRTIAYLDVNTRRQIRLATGIGDMEAYVKEFNNAFANTSQLSTNKPKQGKEVFGETWSNRPRLKKVSREGRIVYIPKQK